MLSVVASSWALKTKASAKDCTVPMTPWIATCAAAAGATKPARPCVKALENCAKAPCAWPAARAAIACR